MRKGLDGTMAGRQSDFFVVFCVKPKGRKASAPAGTFDLFPGARNYRTSRIPNKLAGGHLAIHESDRDCFDSFGIPLPRDERV
jgi:hypothetical protein